MDCLSVCFGKSLCDWKLSRSKEGRVRRDERREHLFNAQLEGERRRRRGRTSVADTRTLECMCVPNMKAAKSVRASNSSKNSSSSSKNSNSNSHYL